MALRVVSSRRVYHFDRIMRAPGRKAASMKPRQKRVATMPPKFVVTPERVEIMPQINMAAAMYQDGREILLMTMLEGICMRM